MGFESLIRTGIAIASQQFESMKLNVAYQPYVGQNGLGKNVLGTASSYRCLVDLTRRQTRTADGQLATIVATLMLLEPAIDVTPLNDGRGQPQQRAQPLDPRDKWTLPDGTTAPVMSLGGFVDSGTGEPFYHEVMLGTV